MTLRRVAGAVTALAATSALFAAGNAEASTQKAVKLKPYTLSASALAELKADFVEQIRDKHPVGTWAPMRMELDDRHLKLMGLPPARVLRRQSFAKPTLVDRRGRRTALAEPVLASYA